MSDADLPRNVPPQEPGGVVVPLRPGDRSAFAERERRRQLRDSRRRRPGRMMRWRRLWLLMIPLGLLAVISTIFGMVVAFASQLPSINHFLVSAHPQNSILYDDDGHRIAVMTDDLHRAYYVSPGQIPPLMKRAIISIEDKRFYSESGVDIKGIARAFLADVTGSHTQGASTITEQLVKVIRQKEFHRTIFEKLIEASLAFQLSHKYTKDEILTAYLNDVYYGNGAYGIEAAAQTYFGNDPTSNLYDCGYTPGQLRDLCVQKLTPAEAALLAGLVQNPPTSWSEPVQSQQYIRRRQVLFDMHQQGYISAQEYKVALQTPLPEPQYVIPPGDEDTNPGYGYFTSWVEQQILDDKKELPNPYTSGYEIHTTLDAPLQNEAQNVVDSILPDHSGLPEASLVAMNSNTGAVLAMVGGYNYNTSQFNTATMAERQPGSSWKVFDLAKALELGVSPSKEYPSEKWTAYVPGFAPFAIRNDEGGYVGERTLAAALTYSDNSVFARVGLEDGATPNAALKNIANYAHDFGITTDISKNPAMTIGGLFTGVTTLDMAHAYSTIARGGTLVSGTLASNSCAGGTYVPPNAPSTERFSASTQSVWKAGSCPGPVGINTVYQDKSHLVVRNQSTYQQIPGYTPYLDQTEQEIMRTVVTEGTGTAADIPNVYVIGKTGTTSNYRDAWWIGSLPDGPYPLTVAVWVGYNSDKTMSTAYGGSPVYGGTYPAVIFKDFVEEALPTLEEEARDKSRHVSEASLLKRTEAPVEPVPVTDLPAYGSPASSGSTTTPSATTQTTTPTTNTNTNTNTGTGTGTGTNTTTQTPTGAGGGAQAP